MAYPDYAHFSNNGRPKFSNHCLVWCEVEFYNGNKHQFFARSDRQVGGRHAEDKALLKVVDAERHFKTQRTKLKLMRMYSSYSPCDRCASLLIDFTSDRPNASIELIFTALYQHEQVGRTRESLKLLNDSLGISMRIINLLDWDHLAQLVSKPGLQTSRTESKKELTERQVWDDLWTEQLEIALQDDEGVDNQHHTPAPEPETLMYQHTIRCQARLQNCN